jgi:Domain of unknown function (DUF1906)
LAARSATRLLIFFLISACTIPRAVPQSQAPQTAYLGFDRNDYPGDANLAVLRKTFAFAGYWLNNPPGANSNSWVGKRQRLETVGFGFLVLFNGRAYVEIKRNGNSNQLGGSDAAKAVASAKREGFPAGTIIFLDQEEGGRMLPEQRAYLHGWIDAVTAAGFGAGVYCSGIAFQESPSTTVITAEDIRQNAGGRKITYWVTNDACPPSPGCSFPKNPLLPSESRIVFADVWQYAQSPRRADFARGCPANYNPDGNCYPPGTSLAQHLHVDVETATSADPSHGRTRK